MLTKRDIRRLVKISKQDKVGFLGCPETCPFYANKNRVSNTDCPFYYRYQTPHEVKNVTRSGYQGVMCNNLAKRLLIEHTKNVL